MKKGLIFILLLVLLSSFLYYKYNFLVSLIPLIITIFVPILIVVLIYLYFILFFTYKALIDSYYRFIINKIAIKAEKQQDDIEKNIEILNGNTNGLKNKN